MKKVFILFTMIAFLGACGSSTNKSEDNAEEVANETMEMEAEEESADTMMEEEAMDSTMMSDSDSTVMESDDSGMSEGSE